MELRLKFSGEEKNDVEELINKLESDGWALGFSSQTNQRLPPEYQEFRYHFIKHLNVKTEGDLKAVKKSG